MGDNHRYGKGSHRIQSITVENQWKIISDAHERSRRRIEAFDGYLQLLRRTLSKN